MNIVKFKKEKKIKICNTENNVHNMIRLRHHLGIGAVRKHLTD